MVSCKLASDFLCSSGWSWICELSASTSWLLELWAYTSMPCFMTCWKSNPRPRACWANTLPTELHTLISFFLLIWKYQLTSVKCVSWVINGLEGKLLGHAFWSPLNYMFSDLTLDWRGEVWYFLSSQALNNFSFCLLGKRAHLGITLLTLEVVGEPVWVIANAFLWALYMWKTFLTAAVS